MARPSLVVLIAVGIVGCVQQPGAPDAAGPDSAFDAEPSDARSEPDAQTGLPTLLELCRLDDGDLPSPMPVANESETCVRPGVPDATAPLFGDLGELPAEYTALHALCGRMDPTPSTRDDVRDAALATELRAFLDSLLDRPALARVLADLPDRPARLDALERIWLPGNAFEHVLCGELADGGQVGGLHLWSEYYLAEREGRADYQCSRGGLSDVSVAAISYRWTPEGRSTPATKPLGSFVVGASPACMLALGYEAMRRGIPSLPSGPSLRAELYGQTRDWVLGADRGALFTLFPLAEP